MFMKLSKKTVLVTGADGFIGSHLVEALLEEGCKVRAFVYYNAFNSWGWLDTLEQEKLKKIDIFAGDVRDPNGVRKAVKGTDFVFHLAALIGIPFSYHSPDSYVDTNIKGTLNILQAAKEYSVEKVVITSTSEVYGTAKYIPIDENHPLQAQSPYSASKIAADKIAESFYLSFRTAVIIARPFNTYGPRQSARAIIPTIVSQVLSKNNRGIKLGRLSPIRDFSYVDDICEGFIELIKSKQAIGKTVNICSGTEISIYDLARLILEMMGSDKKIITDNTRIRPINSEIKRLVGNNELIRFLTSWRTKHSLESGLIKTIKWFKNPKNIALYKGDIYNI